MGMKRLVLGLALLAGAAPPAAANFDWIGHVELDAEGLRSTDANKRLEAVTDLGKYDIALTQDYLLRALDDSDDRVRLAAARALGSGGANGAVRKMVECSPTPIPRSSRPPPTCSARSAAPRRPPR